MKKFISKIMIVAILAQSFAMSVFAVPVEDTTKKDNIITKYTTPKEYEEVEGQCGPFKDLSSDHPNCDAIIYAYENGIVIGYPDGTFRPDNIVIRAELTKIMMESTLTDEDIGECELTPFPDSPRGEWFTKYICAAYTNGFITGYPDGTFGPGKSVNFVEAAKIIVNAFEYELCESDVWYESYVKELISMNAVPESVENVEAYMTRAEVVELIYRLIENITDKESRTYSELNGVEGTGTCTEEDQGGGQEEDEDEEDEEEEGIEDTSSPDLAITDIYLNDKGYLSFELSNVGGVDIEELKNTGSADILTYANGELAGVVVLSSETYAGDDYKQAGGTTVFTGEYKGVDGDEIKVCVNSAYIIDNDADSSNDCMEVTIELLPDLSITNISVEEKGHLNFELSNIGKADIEEIKSGSGDILIYFNGQLGAVMLLSMETSYGDDYKQAGGSTLFIQGEIKPVSGNDIKVCIQSSEVIDNDADPSNDCMTRRF